MSTGTENITIERRKFREKLRRMGTKCVIGNMPKITKKTLKPLGERKRTRKQVRFDENGQAQKWALKGHFSEKGITNAGLSGKGVYNTSDWKSLRKAVLQDEPLCQVCLSRGRVQEAQEVDHIVPISMAEDRAYDIDNLWGLCKPCHSSKTAKEKHLKDIPTTPDNEARKYWALQITK